MSVPEREGMLMRIIEAEGREGCVPTLCDIFVRDLVI